MERTYVQVEAKFLVNGEVRPTCVIWADGTRFLVDSILDVRPGVSLDSKAAGLCYTVSIGNRVTCLYRTGTQWFVDAR